MGWGNGNVYGDSLGLMEKKMETTIVHWGYIGVLLGLYWGYIGVILGLYWGYIGIMEKKEKGNCYSILGLYRDDGKMETTTECGDHIGIMDKKMEASI